MISSVNAKPYAEPHAKLYVKPLTLAMRLIKSIMPKYIAPAKQIKAKVKHAKSSKAILQVPMLLAPLLKVKSFVKPLELAMVSIALFQYLIKQKNVEIFAVLMQKFTYQLSKAEKSITDLAIKVPECYHNFLEVFTKEDLNKVLPHSKYDYKIELLNRDKNYGQAALCGMSKPQLEFVKQFLEENLKKNLSKQAKCLAPPQSYWLESLEIALNFVLTIKS